MTFEPIESIPFVSRVTAYVVDTPSPGEPNKGTFMHQLAALSQATSREEIQAFLDKNVDVVELGSAFCEALLDYVDAANAAKVLDKLGKGKPTITRVVSSLAEQLRQHPVTPADLREPGIYAVMECPTYDLTDSNWALKCGGTSIAIGEVVRFDIGSDEMSITIDNTGKKFCDKLRLGDRVEFEFLNPAVNGGAPLKHQGVIVAVVARARVVQLTSSGESAK